MLSSILKQRINSTYAEYNNDGTIELEARFGRSTNRGFKSGVSIQVFNRIKNYFDSRAQYISTKTTDYITQSIRKTVTSPVGTENSKIIWIEKLRLWNQDDIKYGIRYSMSREVPIKPIPNYSPQIIREKNRYSYYVFQNMVRIDLTMVNMIQGLQQYHQKDQTIYEVEIELVNLQGIGSFSKAIGIVLKKVLDTVVLYTSKEANSVIAFTNMVLGSNKRGIIDHYMLVQARNLKLRDMVWGGLIGNKDTGYSVTHKADGQRKMLVFHTTGIWLLMAPHTLNRLTTTEVKTLTGTILDGEMIPLDKRLRGPSNVLIWYLAFDCLSWLGDKSIQLKPHGMRMNHAQAVADVMKTLLIQVNTKSFRNFGTPQEFFSIMRDMIREQPHLPYKQDGFMFTPINAIYNPHSDKHPLYKRMLTKYSDICKMKPPNQLTVDYMIKWKQMNNIQLYVNKKGRPVPFRGTKIFPYNGEIDSNHPLTQGLPNGTIVEYGWDYKKNILIPHKVRHDKTKPNDIEISEDVWVDIMRPLDMDTLEGNTFKLLRRYHNSIKRHLFNFPFDDNTKNKTLLDIGSGRGGDVSKWRRYSKIVAVEPNLEHIVELKRRIKLHRMEDRVRIVNTGGENTSEIYKNVREFIGGRVDVVSMMLSMSFFWKNQSMLDKLVDTISTNIKRDGNMVFLTVDGDLVEQTFEPAFDTGPILTRLDIGPATLIYNPDVIPKELHIHITGTIVQDQTEWLVRLGDLLIRMHKFGFDFIERKRADEEIFLTE